MKKIILIILPLYCFGQNNTSPKIFQENVISTGDYETHPAFSPSRDTLYFLKCLSDAQFCTICVSYKKNNKWSQPEVVSFSGKYTDADPFVTKDGNTIYFVSNRPVKEGDPSKEDWDIWKTTRNANGWDKPVHLDSPLNSKENEFYPTMADNGDVYFGSSRNGGKGKSDIYVSKFIDGKYSQPENLGDSINTGANEYEPFIATDESYMIFMATSSGVAYADFYMSYNMNGRWSKAKKLPSPVNSDATEWGGKVTRDGNISSLEAAGIRSPIHYHNVKTCSNMSSGYIQQVNGLGDIYYVEMSAVKPER